MCSLWGVGRNAKPPESLHCWSRGEGEVQWAQLRSFHMTPAIPTKKIKVFLSPCTSDPQLASQLREPSLHICIHAYSRGSNEELQHGRTICPLHYAQRLQLAVMLLHEKLQAHGTVTQLKTQPGGYKPNLPAAAAASPPSPCRSHPCHPRRRPTRLPQPPQQHTRLLRPPRALPTCQPDAGGEGPSGPSGHRHGQLLLQETPVQHVE